MNISFSTSAVPSIANKLAYVVRKASTPTVIAASQQFDPPHPQRRITFTDLEPVVYIVNVYETTGLPTLGSLLNSWVQNPEFSDLDIKVQYVSMHEGDVLWNVTDGSWDGYRILYVDRRGMGAQRIKRATDTIPDDKAEVIVRDAPDDDPKGVSLLGEGNGFFEDELVIFTLITRIVTQTPIYNVAHIVRDIRIIVNDASIVADDVNKAILLQGDAGVAAFTVTLPTIGSFDNYGSFFFISEGGSHINVTLDALTNKIFYWNPDNSGFRNVLHLGQSERIWITNTEEGWHVIQDSTFIKQVGQHVEAESFGYVNTRYMDGSLALRTVYRRYWEYLNSPIAPPVATDANWNATGFNFKAIPSFGDGSTTFRFPQVYSAGFPRPVNNLVRSAGNFADSTIRSHEHEETIGTLPETLFGISDTNRLVGQYNRTNTGKPDMCGGDIWIKNGSGLLVKQTASTETAPQSYGVYKSTII